MMASATRGKISIGEGLRMSFDWVPGVVVAVAGSVLAFLRGAAVTDERVSGLRHEISRIEKDAQQFQKDVNAELHETLGRMDSMFTDLKVLNATQATFNQTCTDTLKGVMKKLEHHDTVFMKHHTDIELLKVVKHQ